MTVLSTDLLLCDAVVGKLNDVTPGQAKRVTLPDWVVAKDLRTLRVEVNSGSTPVEIDDSENEGGPFVEWPVMVTIAVSVTAAPQSRLDDLLDQVEGIRQLIQCSDFDLPNDASVHCQNFEYLTRLDPNKLARQINPTGDAYSGVFLSVLMFAFREVT